MKKPLKAKTLEGMRFSVCLTWPQAAQIATNEIVGPVELNGGQTSRPGIGVMGRPTTYDLRLTTYDSRPHNTDSTKFRTRVSTSQATSGLKSNIPNGGTMRRIGSMSQLVSAMTGLIQGRYGEIPNQEAITRTNRAIMS